MKRPWTIALAVLLTGCASLKPATAPGCQGPRRPANPNGSVLGGAPKPTPPSLSPAAAHSGCTGSHP
ncbi:MAG: hypothetical protein ACREE0_10340 [Phenylobacterium sp.]